MPDPVGWVVDQVAGGVATSAGGALFNVLVGWVLDAVISVTSTVVRSFADAADPNVTAPWFVHGADGRLGPYAMSAKIGAVLMVGFVLAGITQGVLTGDVTGMVKRVVLHLPAAVLGTVALGGVTHLGVQVIDALSDWVLTAFDADLQELAGALSTVARSATTGGGTGGGGFVVFVVAVLAALGGLVVVAELVVRSSLVYLVVALAPLGFAAAMWPALRGVARKQLELLGALVASKLVIALALAVAAAALTGGEATGSAGQANPFAIPPPAASAGAAAGDDSPGSPPSGADPQPSPEVVGTLLAGAAAFGVAAFSPLLVVGLFGLTAGATAGQGIRDMPVRGAQRAARTAGSVVRLAAAPTSGGTPLAAGAKPTRHSGTPPAPNPTSASAGGPAEPGRPTSDPATAGGNGSRPHLRPPAPSHAGDGGHRAAPAGDGGSKPASAAAGRPPAGTRPGGDRLAGGRDARPAPGRSGPGGESGGG